MQLTVTLNSQAARDALTARADRIGDAQGLHASMALGVEVAIRDHLRSAGYLNRINALGAPSTGFWKGVSQSVRTESAEATGAVVTIDARGAALHYYGGIVRPTKAKALSIPVHPSAHGVYARQYPQPLAFIPAGRAFGPVRARGDGKFVGFLVRGEPGTITRGPRKGQETIKPVNNWQPIYLLTTETKHDPDPNMLPTETQMKAAAAEAGEAFLGSE